jgi:hypothetical protein
MEKRSTQWRTSIISNFVHDVGSQGIAIYAYAPGQSIDAMSSCAMLSFEPFVE